jgi:hypothetical protein
MRPESNKEHAKGFGSGLEEKKDIIFVNISANLLKLFSFDYCVLIGLSV